MPWLGGRSEGDCEASVRFLSRGPYDIPLAASVARYFFFAGFFLSALFFSPWSS